MTTEHPKYVPCKVKKLDAESLKALSKEELIEKIISLESRNEQLRNIILKNNGTNPCTAGKGASKGAFDFSKCRFEHILLKVLYFGWDYQGYAVQEDSPATIEQHLFDALLKCKLIENRETSNYHRCGRTDKGVSAFGQVISITVRAAEEGKQSLDYCKMLNRLLPADIRVVAWQSVSKEAMEEGAKNLIGTHDFRNLCKMDVGNGVTNFTRNISHASISVLTDYGFSGTPYELCVLTLTAKAFLWHQVRCIVAVLLLIGKTLEKPSIIKELLNVENNPRKPQYPLANDIGLNLFQSEFIYDDWKVDQSEIKHLIETLQRNWTSNAIKACQLKFCISELEKLLHEPVLKQDGILLRQESKIYKPLLSRNLCGSLEERIDHFVKRRRIQKEVS